jgi:hypothetical protein
MEDNLTKLIKDFRIFVARSSNESNRFGKEYVATPAEIVNRLYGEDFPYDDSTKEIFIDTLTYAGKISGSINLNVAYVELTKIEDEQ